MRGLSKASTLKLPSCNNLNTYKQEQMMKLCCWISVHMLLINILLQLKDLCLLDFYSIQAAHAASLTHYCCTLCNQSPKHAKN